jgi:iron complex outermembrane receptor protein
MKTKLAIAGGISLLAIAAPAFAQNEAPPAPDAAYDSADIIVSARRREETLQDVPLSVQAVTGGELQKLEIRQFEDVTKLVPGLSLSKDGSSTSASIRGVNFDARASGSSTTVEFYRNDAVITAGALLQAVYDIGQIEVLRGPQGTLRGRASPSGSITVTTVRPDLGEVGGYVSGSVAQRDKWNTNGAINVPIIADKLAIRLAGFVGESRGNNIGGMVIATGAIDRNVFDKVQAGRASVRADPFDGVLLLDFSYEGIHQKARSYEQLESYSNYLSTAPTSPVLIRPADRLGVRALAASDDRRFKLYNWQATLRQFGQRLTYVGSKTKVAQLFIAPADNGGLFPTVTSTVAPTPATSRVKVFGQLTDNHLDQTTHELRLQNDERIAGLFDYVIGAFQVKSSTPTVLTVPQAVSATASGATPLWALNNFSYRGTYRFRDDKETSLFGNLTLHLGESTEIAGGLRQIWFKADSGVRSGVPGTDLANWVEAASVRRCFGHSDVAGCGPTKKATIYAASVKHDFTDDIMAYASFGTSWRPGNSLVGYRGATVGDFLNQFLNLADEKSKSYEIGLKTKWLNNRVQFNISGFYQKFSNYPFYSTTSVPTVDPAGTALVPGFNFVAPVAAKIKGMEADLSFAVTDRLNVGATVAFADGKIKGGVFPCVDLNDDNIQDTVAPTLAQLFGHVGANQIDTCTADASSSSAPKWSGTVQAEYSHPLSFGDAYLRGFTSWRGHSDGDTINPNDQVKAFALMDLFAGLRGEDGDWDVSVYAKNLLNTRRVLRRSATPLATQVATNGGTATYNYLGITMTEPREVGVNLRISFGSR